MSVEQCGCWKAAFESGILNNEDGWYMNGWFIMYCPFCGSELDKNGCT